MILGNGRSSPIISDETLHASASSHIPNLRITYEEMVKENVTFFFPYDYRYFPYMMLSSPILDFTFLSLLCSTSSSFLFESPILCVVIINRDFSLTFPWVVKISYPQRKGHSTLCRPDLQS